MRISLKPSDVGYINYLQMKDSYAAFIKLDGEYVSGIITADDTEGYVLFCPITDGICETDTNGKYVERIAVGKVDIMLVSKPPYNSEGDGIVLH